MPEQSLHGLNVRARFYQRGAEAVPKGVETKSLTLHQSHPGGDGRWAANNSWRSCPGNEVAFPASVLMGTPNPPA